MTPWIVCLLGSTRFREEYEAETRRLTLQGKIVLTCGVWVHHEAETHNDLETKQMLDELHLRKIDLANEVRVINPGGYVGESTIREIEYALNEWKMLTFLEDMPATKGCCEACHYVGFVDVGGPLAPTHFMRKGWRSVPRRANGTGGYWLCPKCVDAPEEEIEMARIAR